MAFPFPSRRPWWKYFGESGPGAMVRCRFAGERAHFRVTDEDTGRVLMTLSVASGEYAAGLAAVDYFAFLYTGCRVASVADYE